MLTDDGSVVMCICDAAQLLLLTPHPWTSASESRPPHSPTSGWGVQSESDGRWGGAGGLGVREGGVTQRERGLFADVESAERGGGAAFVRKWRVVRRVGLCAGVGATTDASLPSSQMYACV
jgi:hypothetical protein